jgi:ATP-dependent RNA helicase DeaD
MELPSADDLSEHRIDRFMGMLRETLADQDLDYYYRLISRIEQEQELSSTDIAAALTFLGQRERPFMVEELKVGRQQKREAGEGKTREVKKPKRERHAKGRDRHPRRIQPGGSTGGNAQGDLSASAQGLCLWQATEDPAG